MSAVITQNGCPNAVIVLSEKATELEKYAAEELRYHIKKVSKAELPIVTEKANGISIVIGTPDSVPELTRLFPEDIMWLSTLQENGRNWAEDGFAVREKDNTVYIFGTVDRGTLNGVYDFIEENLGVLWIRAKEDIGLVYDSLSTISVEKVNYREKSPFTYRGWTCAGIGDKESCIRSERLFLRNKLNVVPTTPQRTKEEDIGLHYGFKRLPAGHTIRPLLKSSPLYDPDCTEYWNTDDEGNPLPEEESNHVNFFSKRTLETVFAAVLQQIRTTGQKDVFIGIDDYGIPGRFAPYDTEPIEYAPGKFVTHSLKPYVRKPYACGKHVHPDDEPYISTAFHMFINKIARMVKEYYPDARIGTFAYFFTETPPLCAMEDNVYIVHAPLTEEDITVPIDHPTERSAVNLRNILDGWSKLTPNVYFWVYYGCCWITPSYERPIWYKIKKDLLYYAAHHFKGLIPECGLDSEGFTDNWHLDDPMGWSTVWSMNTLTFWLYSKLVWNPEADIPSLIRYFCDKCYGAASPYMQEYYRLIKKGWDEGDKGDTVWDVEPQELEKWMDTFVTNVGLSEPILDTIRKAWDAADDMGKMRIRRIKEAYEAYYAG